MFYNRRGYTGLNWRLYSTPSQVCTVVHNENQVMSKPSNFIWIHFKLMVNMVNGEHWLMCIINNDTQVVYILRIVSYVRTGGWKWWLVWKQITGYYFQNFGSQCKFVVTRNIWFHFFSFRFNLTHTIQITCKNVKLSDFMNIENWGRLSPWNLCIYLKMNIMRFFHLHSWTYYCLKGAWFSTRSTTFSFLFYMYRHH